MIMEKQIMINIPEGKELIQETDKDGNITLKFVDIEPVRSKSWEEFCVNHPSVENEWLYVGGTFGEIKKTNPGRLYFRNYNDKNLLTTKEDVEGILALIQLTRLHDEWVGDWHSSTNFYAIKKYINIGIFDAKECSYKSAFLSFPTDDMANEFLDCFEDLINKAHRFI